MKRIKKTVIIAFAFALVITVLTGCSSNQKTQPTAAPTATNTPTPSPKPTATPTPKPTATPEPIPDVLSVLNDYYSAHEADDEYQIKKKPGKGILSGEYTMSLVADEVPDSNGTAIVQTKIGSSDVEVDFSYSSFFGKDICSPTLIKAVSLATVRAIAESQGLENIEEYTKQVIASYDDSKYTSIVFVGDYACSFKPKDVYATILYAIHVPEFKASFSGDKYESATYGDLAAKLNSGTEYSFKAKVTSYQSGEYRNSFAKYKCLIIEAEIDSGETIRIAQFPEKVPIVFEEGKEYTFYGTTMFDTSDNLIFYLHYAE